ncbi:MAG: D-hexose-6-phosphate mutarotase [Chloroflexi bacterium AL-W]|nr:D-hexose-6-phosphate mutarotase [Chloroflexi bacterium AL-N1]NOK70566.1 D-hexose-6-phosphate mutarotase [Chloroflexi bacterium AL-N10]NOK77558.1 D-hexose-6-phosphate mutarotase [Chloroflexi bacterium AL-N5]NOK84409.1 D-hexose-6-phosphate mutarotase [Chloroflexi bacterium AL-W]NOK92298.1 D-hexose-6-phosphate mutarotase [Chloroflexi bacterium AL-N15]
MLFPQLEELNRQFGVEHQLSFVDGPGGLPVAAIRNTHAHATVALYGGHVLSYQPHDQAPVLWSSAQSFYEVGKPMRGGVPVCWPWFGPHPTDTYKPSHGFARTSIWSVLETVVVANEATRIRLGLRDTNETQTLWPHVFELEITITVGASLEIELCVRNTGTTTFSYSGALHSYFTVSHISHITIHGLEATTYIDQLDSGQRKVQDGPIAISHEIDKVYLATDATCRIDDSELQRHIHIVKTGSQSTVVWNP